MSAGGHIHAVAFEWDAFQFESSALLKNGCARGFDEATRFLTLDVVGRGMVRIAARIAKTRLLAGRFI